MKRPLFIFIVLVCALCACKSPLDIDTPRDRNVDKTNDTLHTNDTTRSGNARVSIVLAFDASGSMSGAGRAAAQSGALKLLDSLDGVKDSAAVLWFDSSVNLFQTLTSYKDSLRAAVSMLPATGATALWDGIYLSVFHIRGRRAIQSRGVVVFSDGMDNASFRTRSQVLAYAIQSQVPVSIIAFGNLITNPQDFRNFTDSTKGTFHQIQTQQQADSVFLVVLRNARKSG
jgi:Mg-chelatase subunit ChlD